MVHRDSQILLIGMWWPELYLLGARSRWRGGEDVGSKGDSLAGKGHHRSVALPGDRQAMQVMSACRFLPTSLKKRVAGIDVWARSALFVHVFSVYRHPCRLDDFYTNTGREKGKSMRLCGENFDAHLNDFCANDRREEVLKLLAARD